MTTFTKSDVLDETSQPTAQIRFKERSDGRRIMQQLWWVITINRDDIVERDVVTKQRGVWRDVECVGPDASDAET